MNAYPLETPLRDLSPARRVYIVRRGLVFLYPASIVQDIANDRYTMGDDRPWTPLTTDWAQGRALSDRMKHARVHNEYLHTLARVLWRSTDASADAFELWWESVNPNAHPEWIGAAALVAGRELMTYPLFKHRHMVDDVHTFP